MHNRGILRTRVACIAVTAWLCAGCVAFDVSGIRPPDRTIRGVAVGLDAQVALELHYSGGSELLSITQDGRFDFVTVLPDGSSYTVELTGQASCVLDSATGVVSGADTEMLLHCGGVMSLASLAISGFTAPDLEFAANRLQYAASVPLLQERAPWSRPWW